MVCKNIINEVVTSREGVLCAECNFRGHILPNNACYCHGSYKGSYCEISEYVDIQVKITDTNVQCECFSDPVNGNFKLDDDGLCTLCYSEAYGPKPGTVLHGEIKDCTMLGGPDIDLVHYQNVYTWKECAGHGIYNFSTQSCDCDSHFQLEQSLTKDISNQDIFLCTTCAEHYGPVPPLKIDGNLFCSKIFSFNSITGEFSECGGAGTYEIETSECKCFENATSIDLSSNIKSCFYQI